MSDPGQKNFHAQCGVLRLLAVLSGESMKPFGESPFTWVSSVGQVHPAGQKIPSQLIKGIFKVRREKSESL